MIYVITEKSIGNYPNVTATHDLSLVERYLAEHQVVSADTESTSFLPFDGKLKTLQLGDIDTQFVIDAETVSILPLKDALKDKTLLFHNFKHDHKWLYSEGIDLHNTYCTFVAECLLTAGYLSKDRMLALDAIALRDTGIELHKGDRGLINKVGLDNERVITYCAEDIRPLAKIRETQLEKIKNYYLGTVLNLENRVTRVLSLMEYNGVLLDRYKWSNVARQAEAFIFEYTEKLNRAVEYEPKLKQFLRNGVQTDIFGGTEEVVNINWRSNQQKKAVLNALGFKLESVDDDILLKLKGKHPIINLILEYAKNAKLVSTYGHSFLQYINKNTGRVHPNYWQIISTGRIACEEPNLLNIPRKGDLGGIIRKAFVASAGYKIVGGDVSNFELRIIAELSQDPTWLKVFNEGRDLHSELCAMTFGIPISDIKKPYPKNPDITYREIQKTVDFALAYGADEFTLSNKLSITPKEAKEIIVKFFKNVPKVQEFLAMLGATGVQYGQICSPAPFHRIRFFPRMQEAKDNDDFSTLRNIRRASMNMPIQAANGDAIKLALVNLQDKIDRNIYKGEIRLSIYDEIQTEVKEEYAEECKVILEETMREAAQVVVKSIPVIVDVGIYDFWSK
jgi:DNA polymerase-1